MSVSLTAVPGTPYATDDQVAFDEARKSHELAMDRSNRHELDQYEQVLRSLQLYGQSIKPVLTTQQQTDLGVAVGTKAAARWSQNKDKTLAILTGIADSMGMTLEQLLTDMQAATIPAEFQAARLAIANAGPTDA